MTKEEWETSRSAPDMLAELRYHNPKYFKTLIPDLHRYFLTCCEKIKYLIPQKHLQDGISGAWKWIAGEIDNAELRRLDYFAEAACFAIEYAKTQEELDEIQALINGIEQLKSLPFNEARYLLKKAAYFAEISMIYPTINHAPFVKSLCTSPFICPDLLREHIHPKF